MTTDESGNPLNSEAAVVNQNMNMSKNERVDINLRATAGTYAEIAENSGANINLSKTFTVLVNLKV